MARTHGLSAYNNDGCRCDKCVTTVQQYYKANRDGYYAEGICRMCRKAPREGTRATCAVCREKFRAYHKAWRATQAQRQKERAA